MGVINESDETSGLQIGLGTRMRNEQCPYLIGKIKKHYTATAKLHG